MKDDRLRLGFPDRASEDSDLDGIRENPEPAEAAVLVQVRLDTMPLRLFSGTSMRKNRVYYVCDRRRGAEVIGLSA